MKAADQILPAIDAWIRQRATPVGPIEIAHDRPWATVLRVPLASGVVWFKACAPVQGFEPRLTAALATRWPDRVAEVLGCDEARGWLLLADAGTPVKALGNPPQIWLAALPRYAELQRGEVVHAGDHLAHGVPDRRLATLPAQYDELLRGELPLPPDEIRELRGFARCMAELCDELAGHGVPETIRHDDLHHANLFVHGDRLRVIDWGDAVISHPFASAAVTFRFLEEPCTTRISSRGPPVLATRSRSPFTSGPSRVGSRTRACGRSCRRSSARCSIPTSRSRCGAPS